MQASVYENIFQKSMNLFGKIVMIGTRVLCSIYNMIKNSIISLCRFIIKLPHYYRQKILDFKTYLMDYKNKLSNLRDTNFELGIYHLYNQNLNDAIIRFKLVDKIFSPNHQESNHWLGWCYFLKNNVEKALLHLEKAGKEDTLNLKSFLQNCYNCTEIPQDIWQQLRDITSSNYEKRFNSDKVYVPLTLVQKAIETITELPDNYNILELGSNVGRVGFEIRKRFPDSFTMIGVETSEKMKALMQIYYPKSDIYDQLIDESLIDLTKKFQNNIEVILSLSGFISTKDLFNYFGSIRSILSPNGYFAFCLPAGSKTEFSLKNKEFIFNSEDVRMNLSSQNLSLLYFDELTLEINNKYYIFVVKKT